MELEKELKKVPCIFLKIGLLSKEDREKISKRYIECIEDREFCYLNNINYKNPNPEKSWKAVYKEMIENGNFK